MLASLTTDGNALFRSQEVSNYGQAINSEFGQRSYSSKLFLSSPKLSKDAHSNNAPSESSITDSSVTSVPASVFCDPLKTVESNRLLLRARSWPRLSSAGSVITPCSRIKSADFTSEGAMNIHYRAAGHSRTNSSLLPIDPTDIVAPEALGDHMSIAPLVKRRREIEEQMMHLHAQLLESFREEWVLTGVIPAGFTKLLSQMIASNPNLKTTSFPFTHLIPSSRSERNAKNLQNSACALPTSNESIHRSQHNSNIKLSSKDSLTSSLSSVMGTSFYWSQCDATSVRTSCSFGGCEHNQTLEIIAKRLQDLEIDFAVVSQLHQAHKQRAKETKKAVFRQAYKSNEQRLKQISKEKLALEEQQRKLKLIDLSNGVSKLTKSTGLLQQETFSQAVTTSSVSFAERPVAAMPPRRKTFQFPFTSTGGTLRLGKLRKRSSLANTEIETRPTPIVHTQQNGGSVNRIHRASLFSTILRLPRHHDAAKSEQPKLDGESKPEMIEVSQTVEKIPRPYSLSGTIFPKQRSESISQLNRTQIQRAISFPSLVKANNAKPAQGLMWNSSSFFQNQNGSKVTGNKLTELRVSILDDPCPSPSEIQSSSGCYSNTSPSSSILAPSSKVSEVRLRRPVDVEHNQSPIRCICSCIFDHNRNCECAERIHKSNDLKGLQQLLTLPKHITPTTSQRRRTRLSINPLWLFRLPGGKRNSSLNQQN